MVHLQALQDFVCGLPILGGRGITSLGLWDLAAGGENGTRIRPRSLKPTLLMQRNLSGLDGQVCGFPTYDAAGNFTDALKSIALQETRGNG
jgi:hypothetical protein